MRHAGVPASAGGCPLLRLRTNSLHPITANTLSGVVAARRLLAEISVGVHRPFDLLLRGDFPAIHVPSIASQEVLRLLRYRHRLVGMRTMLKNGLQAVMLSNRVLRTSRMRTLLWRHHLEKLPLTGADARRREHSLPLMDELSARIEASCC